MAPRVVHLAALVGIVVLFGLGASASQALGSARSLMSADSLENEMTCTPVTTKALVQKFVRDYDSGQVAVIDRLWAREPYFQWFSTRAPGARLGAAAYNRSTLASYFRARVRAHENLRVIKLGAGYDVNRNIVNFAGKLVRRADHLPAGAPKDFKGAVRCGNRPLLIVWSM
jgi:hypothetical protein